MNQYRCTNCGGELGIGMSGRLECPYCGNTYFLSEKELKENLEFRNKILAYGKAKNDEKEFDYSADTLWKSNGTVSLDTANNKKINIQYMRSESCGEYECYLARESVVYVFKSDDRAAAFLNGLKRMSFPEADEKLYRCFPQLKMDIKLKTGRCLAFLRRPGFYPLSMFPALPSEHLAWVISRMENICCALEYSEISHNCIDRDSIYINRITHEGALFGNWGKVSKKVDSRDLVLLRKTAADSAEDIRKPKELKTFLDSKPCASAFDDFKEWDKVIEMGFGGHNFVSE